MSQKIVLAKDNKTTRTTRLSYRWLATAGLIAYYILLCVNIYIYIMYQFASCAESITHIYSVEKH